MGWNDVHALRGSGCEIVLFTEDLWHNDFISCAVNLELQIQLQTRQGVNPMSIPAVCTCMFVRRYIALGKRKSAVQYTSVQGGLIKAPLPRKRPTDLLLNCCKTN